MFTKSPTRFGAVLALVSALSIPASTPAFAQGDLADEAKHRVDLAGRQRMLSQRMSMSACFVFTGVEREKHLETLALSYSQFADAHDALLYGSETDSLSREMKPEIISALADVDETWVPYSRLVKGIIDEGRIDLDTLVALDALGLEVLAVMNTAVGKIARAYGESLDELPLILTVTIDLAGRQRMFTQKMSKEFCLIDAGINAEENRADLKQRLEFFNSTHDGLVNGIPGTLIPAPNYDIRTKLAEVSILWESANAVLTRIVDGGEITDNDRGIISSEIEAVLATMNEAVGMYEFVVIAPD